MSGTRKANGESWISETPNAQGLYEAKVWMGLRPDGKPDRRNVRRKSLASVRKRVKELEGDRDAGKVTRPGRVPTVRELLERHLNTVLPSQDASPKTIQSYRSLYKVRIYPRWGGLRADRLLPSDIQNGLAAWRKAGLAPSTRRKILAALSSAYAVAVDQEELARNPGEKVRPPQASQSELAHLSQPEMRAVIAVAGERLNSTRWATALLHGLRQGEALGLRWEYLDLDKAEARIWWQLQRLTWAHGCADADPDFALIENEREQDDARARIEHQCAAAHCKTKPCPRQCSRHTRACPPPCPPGCRDHARLCPDRALPSGAIQGSGALVLREIKEKRHKTIQLGDGLARQLRAHRTAQRGRRLKAGQEWEDHDLVWCQWNGRPLDPRRDWAEWGDILEAAGLPHHRVHAIRHSAATMLRDTGTEPEVVQEMLGHSDIRMTRRYTQTGKGAARAASERAERALGLAAEGS